MSVNSDKHKAILQSTTNQTKDMCIQAIEQDPYLIQYVNDQTEDLCLMAVNKQGLTLKYIENQTLNICCTAVVRDSEALKYVQKEFRTEEFFKMIVQENGLLLCFIDERYKTDEICALAMKQNKYARKSRSSWGIHYCK